MESELPTGSQLEVSMTRPPLSILSALSLVCILATFGCGGNTKVMGALMPRQLQSITVTPQNATAQSVSKQVQFTATGKFNMDPMTAMPQVMWSVGNPFATNSMQPAGVSINANGLASCATFTGTVIIEATSPMDPEMPLSQMNAMTSKVSGMAQLTCP